MITDLMPKSNQSPHNGLGQQRAVFYLFCKVLRGNPIEKLSESMFYLPVAVLFKKEAQNKKIDFWKGAV